MNRKIGVVFILFSINFSEAKPFPKDTIDLIVLIDLFETHGDMLIPEAFKPGLIFHHELDRYGNRIIRNNPKLSYERNYISSIVKKELKDKGITQIKGDTTCLKGLLRDSISRRNFNDIKDACQRCNFENLLLLDIKWSYENQVSYFHTNNIGKTKPYFRGNYPATFFRISISYYKLALNKTIYFHEYGNLRLYGSQEPGKIINGHEHSKFFRKVAKDFKKFLARTKAEVGDP